MPVRVPLKGTEQRMRRFICWAWGHRGFHPFQFPYPGRVRTCTRCGFTQTGTQVCVDGFAWRP